MVPARRQDAIERRGGGSAAGLRLLECGSGPPYRAFDDGLEKLPAITEMAVDRDPGDPALGGDGRDRGRLAPLEQPFGGLEDRLDAPLCGGSLVRSG